MISEQVYHEALILDAHHDIYELNHRLKLGEEFPLRDAIAPRFVEAGIDIVFWAIGGDSWLHSNYTDLPLKGTLANWARMERQIAACDGTVLRVESAARIPSVPDGKLRIIYALEGGKPLKGSLDLLDAFCRLGIRLVQPVWNYRNELGDGALETGFGNGGLSEFGKRVVERMNQLEMVVDLAHLTEQGALDALEISAEPVIVSHANAQAVCPHPRNLRDNVIRAVAESDGCIGVHAFPSKVATDNPSLEKLIDHVAYISDLVGSDHVGLSLNTIAYSGERPSQDEVFAVDGQRPHALANYAGAKDVSKLTRAMLDRGFSNGEVHQVLGENFIRVLRRVAG